MRPRTERLARAAFAVPLAAVLAGCALLVPKDPAVLLAPLDIALSRSAGELAASAEQGTAQEQYALALAYAYGLNGAERDPLRAELWRGKAQAQRGYLPITQYTPAFNGNPSRINIINLPQYGITPASIVATEACAAVLAQRGTDTGPDLCGGSELSSRLETLWRAATR